MLFSLQCIYMLLTASVFVIMKTFIF